MENEVPLSTRIVERLRELKKRISLHFIALFVANYEVWTTYFNREYVETLLTLGACGCNPSVASGK